MSKVLELEFITDKNKVVRLAIPNPTEPVDSAKAEAVLDQLVASGILSFKTGQVAKKSGAVLRDSESTPILQ